VAEVVANLETIMLTHLGALLASLESPAAAPAAPTPAAAPPAPGAAGGFDAAMLGAPACVALRAILFGGGSGGGGGGGNAMGSRGGRRRHRCSDATFHALDPWA
jgi:hypothetical protein